MLLLIFTLLILAGIVPLVLDWGLLSNKWDCFLLCRIKLLIAFRFLSFVVAEYCRGTDVLYFLDCVLHWVLGFLWARSSCRWPPVLYRPLTWQGPFETVRLRCDPLQNQVIHGFQLLQGPKIAGDLFSQLHLCSLLVGVVDCCYNGDILLCLRELDR